MKASYLLLLLIGAFLAESWLLFAMSYSFAPENEALDTFFFFAAIGLIPFVIASIPPAIAIIRGTAMQFSRGAYLTVLLSGPIYLFLGIGAGAHSAIVPIGIGFLVQTIAALLAVVAAWRTYQKPETS